ncbi:DUF3159 domain-containing protein [Buchananella hordeovulneris]|uniref:DUF3159 domain-containing protein n=1 Tax=Buchananella hordeovulneris TaxID=52770 RepID=UPI00163A0E8F|nr:DUF3159 domain-containing protein [Buchananella hordeovulneris]
MKPTPRGKAGWLGQVGSSEFSVQQAVGGWRGVVDSLAPTLAFVVLFLVWRDLRLALVVAGVVCAVLVAARLVTRSPLTQAFSGVVGLGIGVVWAWRSGQGTDVFLPGILINAAYGGVIALLALARLPVAGVVLGVVHGRSPLWFRSASAGLQRACKQVTWLWVGVFALRIAVKLPLYLAGAVGPLGVAHLALGLPLMALASWFTWVWLRVWAQEATQPGQAV